MLLSEATPPVRTRRAHRTTATLAVAAVLIAGAFAPPATASYGIASGASHVTLRVDAQGDAGASWTAAGTKVSFVIPKTGQGRHGTVTGDVSRRSALKLVSAVTVRRTSDGTNWALQELEIAGRPASLDFSRWKGSPTQLTLAVTGDHLVGKATFNGRPVTGFSPTPGGQPLRIYVYLECFGCPGHAGAWSPMVGVPPKADGSFSVYLRSSWVGKQYRATVVGPNVGGQYAPDAQAVVSGS